MGLSIRARRIMAQRAAEKAAAQRAADQEQQRLEAEHHAAYLSRSRAADFLGVSVHRLKRLMTAGTGPTCSKAGESKQSPVRWHIDELRAWKADPRAYIAARNAREAAHRP